MLFSCFIVVIAELTDIRSDKLECSPDQNQCLNLKPFDRVNKEIPLHRNKKITSVSTKLQIIAENKYTAHFQGKL